MCYLLRGCLWEVENKVVFIFFEMRIIVQGWFKNKFKSFYFISFCIVILYFLISVFIFILKFIFYKNIEYIVIKYNNVKRMFCVVFFEVRICSDFEF